MGSLKHIVSAFFSEEEKVDLILSNGSASNDFLCG